MVQLPRQEPAASRSRIGLAQLRALGRFFYFAAQEFSRIRGFEKASALGYQTVFSLIPAMVLFLSVLQIFGTLEGLSDDITRFIMHQLNLDRIEVRVSAEAAPENDAREKSSPAASPRDANRPGQAQPATIPAGKTGTPQQPSPSPGADAAGGSPMTHPISVRLSDQVNRLVSELMQKIRSRSVNVISLLWFVAAAMSLAITLETALNDVWGATSHRAWVHRFVVYWTVLTLGPLLIGLPVSLARRAEIPLEGLAVSALSSTVAFFLIYYWVPVAPVRPWCALLGAACATTAWEMAKYLFGLYLEHAVGYGRIYGNLGLLPLTLFWLWISWIIVLGGAAIAYTAQNRSRLEAAARGLLTQANLNVGWVLLALILRLARAFRSGEGPVSAERLATASGLPDRDWLQLVALLQKKGIVVTVGTQEEAFHLGRAADELSVAELFGMLEQQLPQYFEEQWPAEAPKLLWVFNKWRAARDGALGGVTIAQLLRQPQEEPAVTEPPPTSSRLPRWLRRWLGSS